MKKYKEAVKYAEEAEQALRDQIRQYKEASDSISSAKSSIDSAKKYVKDVSSAEELLQLARSSFEKKEIKNALDYLEQCENERKRLLEESQPCLSLNLLTHDKLKADAWNRLEFNIKNTGNTHANNVVITFPESFEVKTSKEELNLNIDEEKKIEIGIKTRDSGNLPVDVTVSCEHAFDGKVFEFETVQWLNIEGPIPVPPTPPPTEKADLCPNCRKPVRPDWVKCPYCKTQLKIEKQGSEATEADVEDRVLAYVKVHGGSISISQCAEALGIPEEDVRRNLKELEQKGRIKK